MSRSGRACCSDAQAYPTQPNPEPHQALITPLRNHPTTRAGARAKRTPARRSAVAEVFPVGGPAGLRALRPPLCAPQVLALARRRAVRVAVGALLVLDRLAGRVDAADRPLRCGRAARGRRGGG